MLPLIDISPPPIEPGGLPDRFTNPGEYAVLAYLANAVSARRVIEIGINEGRAAAMLLANVPTIQTYVGIDVPRGTLTALAVQRTEVPDEVGKFVAGDPRVRLIVREGGSSNVAVDELPVADFVFIDGDHSVEGVVNDSHLAWALVRRGVIVWHDYHPGSDVEVKPVLDRYFSQGHRIVHVRGTWLAYEEIGECLTTGGS